MIKSRVENLRIERKRQNRSSAADFSSPSRLSVLWVIPADAPVQEDGEGGCKDDDGPSTTAGEKGGKDCIWLLRNDQGRRGSKRLATAKNCVGPWPTFLTEKPYKAGRGGTQ